MTDEQFLAHYGIDHNTARARGLKGSGRYPWGSGSAGFKFDKKIKSVLGSRGDIPDKITKRKERYLLDKRKEYEQNVKDDRKDLYKNVTSAAVGTAFAGGSALIDAVFPGFGSVIADASLHGVATWSVIGSIQNIISDVVDIKHLGVKIKSIDDILNTDSTHSGFISDEDIKLNIQNALNKHPKDKDLQELAKMFT